MGWAIRFGGISVIIAVFGIFYFIGKEVIPLFKSANVETAGKAAVVTMPRVLGVILASISAKSGYQPSFSSQR